jgi:hypothetical protein
MYAARTPSFEVLAAAAGEDESAVMAAHCGSAIGSPPHDPGDRAPRIVSVGRRPARTTRTTRSTLPCAEVDYLEGSTA